MRYGDSPRKSLRWPALIGLALVGLVFLQCGSDNPTDSPTAQLLVWPAEVSFSAVEQGSDPNHVLINVDCDPRGCVTFSFSEDCNWLTLSNLAGTNEGVTRDSFSVRASISGLEPGVYVDRIVVTSSSVANSPQYVDVSLTVNAITPMVYAWPPRLDFESANEWTEVDVDSIFVTSNTGDNYPFTAEHANSWFTLSKSSGVTTDTIEVALEMPNLTGGAHVDTVFIRCEDADNSPRTVACSLWIPPWQTQESPLIAQLADVFFADDLNGWAVGLVEDGYSDAGFTLVTDDGGHTWRMVEFLDAQAGDYWGFASVCIAADRVCLVGESGIIRVSDDMGETWTGRSTGLADTLVDLYDVVFATADVGWIVGDGGLVLKTTDGGETWVEKSSGVSYDLLCVTFVDELHGWAAGSGYSIIRTVDGGDTWTEHSTSGNDYRGVSFIDENTGWIAGKLGGIRHTTDGGQTWVVQPSGVDMWLNDILFVDAFNGWACGQGGTILYTDDGGTTWTAQVSETEESLYGISFLSATKGWLVGKRGVIRYTSSAGNP